MRTLLLLVTGLLSTAPLAAAEATTLFEDAEGDVGPWPTWIVGRGLPAPADADLLAASLDGATLTLVVAALPADLPRDRVWAAGWSLEDGSYLGAGYVTHRDHTGGSLCRWAKAGEYGPEGEPECVDVEATATAGAPGAFTFALPEDAVAGALADVGGAVVLLPDGVAEPLVVLHATGATLLDVAFGEDVPAPANGTVETLEEAAAPVGSRDAPGLAAVASALGALGAALAARRR